MSFELSDYLEDRVSSGGELDQAITRGHMPPSWKPRPHRDDWVVAVEWAKAASAQRFNEALGRLLKNAQAWISEDLFSGDALLVLDDSHALAAWVAGGFAAAGPRERSEYKKVNDRQILDKNLMKLD